jgi:hypothetical protein
VTNQQQCQHCRPRHQSDYLGWMDYAERQYRAGLRQEQCPGCSRWRWPDELPASAEVPQPDVIVTPSQQP